MKTIIDQRRKIKHLLIKVNQQNDYKTNTFVWFTPPSRYRINSNQTAKTRWLILDHETPHTKPYCLQTTKKRPHTKPYCLQTTKKRPHTKQNRRSYFKHIKRMTIVFADYRLFLLIHRVIHHFPCRSFHYLMVRHGTDNR